MADSTKSNLERERERERERKSILQNNKNNNNEVLGLNTLRISAGLLPPH
jgi:hypothetical protein